MLIYNFYKTVLINPKISLDANKLFIVSGYSSATFARRHITDLLNSDDNFEINLIIGMPGAKNDHLAFLQLHQEFEGKFKGYYFRETPPVHSKVYSWFRDNNPIIGFAGSANYSQAGFFSAQQINQISDENPSEIKTFYDGLIDNSIFIPDHVLVFPEGHHIEAVGISVPAGSILWEIPNTRVRISFLDKQGNLPAISGLNWGQRLEKRINRQTDEISFVRREPNQAYLSLKLTSRDVGFLPPRAFTFSLVTDDRHSFDCVVAQGGRKAIHSTTNNSLLGIYFRNRLGVALGAPITKVDLERYGRTDYTIEKINDETFLLDFSI